MFNTTYIAELSELALTCEYGQRFDAAQEETQRIVGAS